jgi:hypothetical protein
MSGGVCKKQSFLLDSLSIGIVERGCDYNRDLLPKLSGASVNDEGGSDLERVPHSGRTAVVIAAETGTSGRGFAEIRQLSLMMHPQSANSCMLRTLRDRTLGRFRLAAVRPRSAVGLRPKRFL